MAATRLIPLHENKGKTVSQCLKDRVDYAKNGEKTEEGEYVTAYECNPQIVDQEFYSARNEYVKDHRVPTHDVIAYQIRQSFKPGEITPEEANAIGYELAMKFTKGEYAFIVATHTDKAHIHNHIIFNSTNLACDRKFKNFFLSSFVIQRISDRICLEHGLSVIKPRAYRDREKRTDYPRRSAYRDAIREAIDRGLARNPKDLEELLRFLEEEEYQIKRGQNPAIKGKEQKRFIRFKSLGEGYRQEDLEKIISGEMERDPEIVQTLPDIPRKSRWLRHDLCRTEHLRPFQSQAPGHDQADISGAEQHHAPADHDVLSVDQVLSDACGEYPCRPRSRNGKHASGPLSASCSKHNCFSMKYMPAAPADCCDRERRRGRCRGC